MEANKYTSLALSKKLYEKGFIFDYNYIWKRGEVVQTGNDSLSFADYNWDLIDDDGSVGLNDASFPAYDILHDLCVKYPKKLFGEILLSRAYHELFCDQDVWWSFLQHPEMILALLQENQKDVAEKYIIENLVCPKCHGTGSYWIPISSPIMAPYGRDNTVSVPCECKIRGKNET